MADGSYRVFLSAVSSELGAARRAIAMDLRARGLSVREQEDFTQHPDTTLHKLHDYIRDCDAVVCVIGRRDGAMPQAEAPAQFPGVLPAGIAEASYTQWELFLARHFRRRLLRYIAEDAFYTAVPAWDARQMAFVQHIKDTGQDRYHFVSLDGLRADVLRQYWPEMLTGKPIDLRYPTLGSLFKGRDVFLRRLRDALHDDGHAAIHGRAVHGLGGVGKTRAAVEYAWASLGDYSALLFVEAATPEGLRRDIAALCDRLAPSLTAPEQNVRFEAVLGWLNTHPGWLLILDNIDDAAALSAAERLIAGVHGGHVLLTGRFSGHPAGVPAFDLEVLPPTDAAAFLLERTEDHRRPAADDAAQARALAVEMDGLALALEMAGAFIEHRACGLAQYLDLWRGNRAKVSGWSSAAATPQQKTVDTTWTTSIEHLAPAARALLERLAFLAPDPVPEFLLDVPIPGVEPEDLPAALDDLAAYSLVRRLMIVLRHGEQRGFSVHRLLQDVTRRSPDDSARQRRLAEALAWVDSAWVGNAQDVRDWKRLDPLAPHARALARQADEAGIAAPTARLMNRAASLLHAKALHAEAEPLMRRALAIDEASFGPDHPNVATALNDLAQLLRATNRLAEAEPLMRRALAIAEASLGPDHPTVATALNNLAQLLWATNRLAEAAPLMRHALAIDEASFGPDHPEVAIDLNNLALLLQATNRLAEAEPLVRRALAVAEANLGPDQPTVAAILINLAGLLRATNRLAEAGPLLRRCLAIFFAFEGQTGHVHPHRDEAIANYAALLAAMGRSAAETGEAIAALWQEAGLDGPAVPSPRP